MAVVFLVGFFLQSGCQGPWESEFRCRLCGLALGLLVSSSRIVLAPWLL